MNIHFMAGTRVPTPRGHKPSKAGTKPPRSRDSLDRSKGHNVYAGGKYLRKRLARLAARQAAYNAMSSTKQVAHTLPGAM